MRNFNSKIDLSLCKQCLAWLLFTFLLSCHSKIPPIPEAKFDVQNDNCTAPCEIGFLNGSKNAGSYVWDFGDGFTSTEENPKHKYLGGAKYEVKLVATGDAGSHGIGKTVTTVAPPGVNAAFDVTNNNCTVPCTVGFINQSSNASSYVWKFDDGTTSTQTNPTKEYTKAGNHTVELTATGAGGTKSAPRTVTTVPPPTAPVAAFTIANNNCTAPCTVNFTNQSSNASSYNWDFGDNTSSTQTNPSKEYKTAGSYVVKLTANGPGGSVNVQNTVTIASGVESAPSKVWDSTIGGSGIDLCQTLVAHSDGGYFALGSSKSNTGFEKKENSRGGFDFWLVKINSNGKRVWDETYGGSGDDIAFSIAPTSDGGAILAGYSNSSRSGDKSDNSRGKNDIWIVKVNSNGVKQWDRTFGGNDDDENPRIIVTPNDNGYLFLAESSSNQSGEKNTNSKGERDFWLVKLNSDGSKNWDKTIGGDKSDFARSILRTNDGGYLLYGESLSNQSGEKSTSSKGGRDYWLVKVNSNGDRRWDKSYGGDGDENASTIVASTDGGFFLAGDSPSGISGDKREASRGERDYWVVKINESGDKLWDKTLGGSSHDNAGITLSAPNGACIVTGYTVSSRSGDKNGNSKGGRDSWIVKLSASGTIVWDFTLGGSRDETVGTGTFSTDGSGSFTLGGSSNSPQSGDKSENSRGNEDYWIIKFK